MHSNILKAYGQGIDQADWPGLVKKYGQCQLNIPSKGIVKLLVEEVLNPFYLFQVFSMILWFQDGYVKYAICILVISLGGVI